jgi:hypothetical protein
MQRLILLAFMLVTLVGRGSADSLWDAEHGGYYVPAASLRVGDVVAVQIDIDTAVSFSADRTDDRSITLEVSGGEASGLLNFLPQAAGSTDSRSEGDDELSIQGIVVARVQELDDNGMARIEAIRTVQVENATERFVVTGWLDPRDLSEKRTISFDRLADAALRYTGVLPADGPILTDADLTTILTEPFQTTEGAAPATPGEAAGAPGVQQAPADSGYALTEERKRELLLQYVNRVLDIIF